MNKYKWTLTIDDSLCAYEYEIDGGRGDVSIREIAELIEKFVQGKIVGEKYVEGSGEAEE